MPGSQRTNKKFIDYHVKLRSSLTEEQMDVFKSLKSNKERILFVADIPNRPAFPIYVQENRGKNFEEAKELKDRGNEFFQKGNYGVAFSLYSQAILKSSQNTPELVKELAIFYANRSAALYHLQKYELSIKDTDSALNMGYPTQLKYKVLDRKARCYLALEKRQLADEVFKQTISALDDARLPLEKRQKWQKDIQIMLLMMSKNKRRAKSTTNDEKLPGAIIKGKRNPKYNAITSAIAIEYTEELGRHAVANTDIKAGEVVAIEDPHCAVLLPTYRNTNCHLCFNRIELLHPCPTCDQVIFCSEACANIALSSFHGIECSILSNFWDSDISITCMMAMRIITQKKLQYYLNKKKGVDDMKTNEPPMLNSLRYESVQNLLTHESRRKPEDLLNRAHMALFLLECLRRTYYFKGSMSDEGCALTDEEIYIGELLLNHLQILQFNAHEVSEVQIPNDNIEASSSEFIGGALYPTLALFNHSCNPAVIRYFEGTRVVAVTVRNLKAGDWVGENYGPLFTETARAERRRILNDQYWFHCTCEACTDDWPTIQEMNRLENIRLRCSNEKCRHPININPSADSFWIKCNVCLQNVNMFKPLKALQESDGKFAVAKSFMKVGKTKRALEEFLKIMSLLDRYLVPPFKDFYLCQQAIRTCFLMMGNVYKYSNEN